MPGTCWPVSLVLWVSSRPVKDSCLQKRRQKACIGHPKLSSYLQTPVHMYVSMYTCEHVRACASTHTQITPYTLRYHCLCSHPTDQRNPGKTSLSGFSFRNIFLGVWIPFWPALSGTGSHWDTGLLWFVSSLHFSDYSRAWLLPESLSWNKKPGLDVLNPGTLGTLGMPNRRDDGASPPLHSRYEKGQLQGRPSGWAQSCLIESFAQVPVQSTHG